MNYINDSQTIISDVDGVILEKAIKELERMRPKIFTSQDIETLRKRFKSNPRRVNLDELKSFIFNKLDFVDDTEEINKALEKFRIIKLETIPEN